MNNKPQKWQHPGGKLRELEVGTLTATFKRRQLVDLIEVR
jgi:hypothetical protein